MSLKLDEMITKASFHLFFPGSSYHPSLCQTWAMSATSRKELAAGSPCPLCCWTQVHVPDTQWGQANQKVRVWRGRWFTTGPSKENVWLLFKGILDGFQGRVFKGKILDEGCRVVTLFWLAVVTSQGSAPGLLHLALPSSTSKVDFVPAEGLKDTLLHRSLEEELGPCFMATLLFIECFSFVCTFPNFPNQ